MDIQLEVLQRIRDSNIYMHQCRSINRSNTFSTRRVFTTTLSFMLHIRSSSHRTTGRSYTCFKDSLVCGDEQFFVKCCFFVLLKMLKNSGVGNLMLLTSTSPGWRKGMPAYSAVKSKYIKCVDTSARLLLYNRLSICKSIEKNLHRIHDGMRKNIRPDSIL